MLQHSNMGKKLRFLNIKAWKHGTMEACHSKAQNTNMKPENEHNRAPLKVILLPIGPDRDIYSNPTSLLLGILTLEKML